MKNKVLVKVIIPELDIDYDLYIPVNELIWRVKKMIVACTFELSNCNYNIKDDNYFLLNKITGKTYDENVPIINTDIRNGTELILLSE